MQSSQEQPNQEKSHLSGVLINSYSNNYFRAGHDLLSEYLSHDVAYFLSGVAISKGFIGWVNRLLNR